jgi:hypothetical protein
MERDVLELGPRVARLLALEAQLGPAIVLWAYDQILRVVGLSVG